MRRAPERKRCRASFEQWLRGYFVVPPSFERCPLGYYKDPTTVSHWHAWLASRGQQ